jgi:uncharacterized HAD superfamily protein
VHRDAGRATEYKPRIVRERRLDVLIEDEHHVAAAVAAIPVPVLLFDRPWNRAEPAAGVTRVTTWNEILAWVESRTASSAGPRSADTNTQYNHVAEGVA